MIPRFSRFQDVLPNGLRLVTVELPHLHTATVVMYAKVGSRYESQHDNGLSHFLEHMLFRGTARYPDAYQINLAIEEIGGTLYAETGRDYSLYQLSLHPDTLDAGIALFGEIFRAPAFQGIEVERRIILEEILEDLDEDSREINIDDLARATVFPDHPLGYKITGPYENVERFTVADVRRHFERCYGARNMVLTVAGACERSRVLKRVSEELGPLAPGTELGVEAPPESGGGPRFRYVENQGSQTSLQVLFRALPETSPDYPALQVLSRVLDDGMSTRLHHRVCDELGLAYYVSANIEAFVDTALFELDATSAHANVAPLLGEALTLLSELGRSPPSEAEVAKAKRRYRWDLEATFDDPDAMAGWWGGTELFFRPLPFEDKVARMEAVTPADVRRVAAAVFQRERMTVAAVGLLDEAQVAEVKAVVEKFR
ncbi:MAG: insulinase family protein [Myxococcales bacterium]|nr:insulinase family protein [Myxococcales bacterium]